MVRTRARSVAILASCLCVLAPLAAAGGAFAADSGLDEVMNALAQRKQGHVSFVEKKFISILDRPVESSGELVYEAPDRLEQRTLKPKPETLVVQGNTVSAQRGRRHYVLDLRQYPQIVPFIESLRATLAGDRAALERVFKIDFSGSVTGWQLALQPLDAQLAKTVREIHIEGEKDTIHSVEILNTDGDRSLLTLGAEVTQ